MDLAEFFPNPEMVQAGYALVSQQGDDRVTWCVSGNDVSYPEHRVIMFGLRGMYNGKPSFPVGDNYLWAPDANGVWYAWTITVPHNIRSYPRIVETLPAITISSWTDPAGVPWEIQTVVQLPGQSPWSFPPAGAPIASGVLYQGVTIMRPQGTEPWRMAEVFGIGMVPIAGTPHAGVRPGLRQFSHWDAVPSAVECRGTWYPDFGGVCLIVDETYSWVQR